MVRSDAVREINDGFRRVLGSSSKKLLKFELVLEFKNSGWAFPIELRRDVPCDAPVLGEDGVELNIEGVRRPVLFSMFSEERDCKFFCKTLLFLNLLLLKLGPLSFLIMNCTALGAFLL